MAVGAYFGGTEWVRGQLHSKAVKQLAPLDRIDAARGLRCCPCAVNNSAQCRHHMLEHIDGLVNNWLRAQRTAYTCVAPAAAA